MNAVESSDALATEIGRLPSGWLSMEAFEALYLKVHPEDRNAPDWRRRMGAAAEGLAVTGAVRLPGRSGWDRNGPVPLPLRLRIPPRPAAPAVRRPPVSWVPALSWASEVTDPRRHEMLVAVNAFLIGCGGHPVPVPEKERSLEIFGDEKRISTNLRDGRFLGVLDLSTIGAVRVHAPLPCMRPDTFSPGKPLLVVENEDSFHSLAGWNAPRGRLSGVVYASGNAFRKTAAGLDDLVSSTGATEIRYLGDLDTDGIELPAAVDATRRAEGLLPLLPCVDFYLWLLANGSPLPARAPRAPSDAAIAWLPASIGPQVRQIIASGARIPQEFLGTLALARDYP